MRDRLQLKDALNVDYGRSMHTNESHRVKLLLPFSVDRGWHYNHNVVLMALGEFEYLLITTAATLGENAYGAAMREAIAQATGRACSIGALYTTLDRLEAKGLIKTWMAEGTPQRGGRSRRMVRVTIAGKAAASNFYQTIIRVSGRAPWATRHTEEAG